jgi:hypothetical protein
MTEEEKVVFEGAKKAARILQIEQEFPRFDSQMLFIRLFVSLDIFFGGREDNMVAWVNAHNYALKGIPRVLIQNEEGLKAVMDYLENL